MNLTPTDLLPLQLFLAKQLPEEIGIYGQTGKFTWRGQSSVGCIAAFVTPREWDYVARMVEEKLTEEQKERYLHKLQALQDGLFDKPFSALLWWTATAPWSTRTIALMKELDTPATLNNASAKP